MSIEENKALVRRVIEEIWCKGNLAAIDELIAPNFVFHDPNFQLQGRDSFSHMVSATRTAFPDLHTTVDDQIAEGDKVVTRFTQHGVHAGEFVWFGLAPTGQQVTITGIEVVRIEAGKIADRWLSLDLLGMLQQMGVVSLPGQGGA